MTSPQAQVTRVSAYGLVLQDDRLLLCRLSRHFPQDAGCWTLPGGGVEFGEDPAAAVVREMYEETGLTVTLRSLAGIDSFCVEDDQRAFHAIRIIYHAAQIGGALRNEVDGSTDLCAWWSLAEAQRLPLVDLARVGLKLAFATSTDGDL